MSAGQLVAVVIIVLLSLLNFIGLVLGAIIQNISTVLKIITLIGIVVLGFLFGKGGHIDYSLASTGFDFSKLLMGFGVAMIAVIWTYDGWNNINFAAGEIKNPSETCPCA